MGRGIFKVDLRHRDLPTTRHLSSDQVFLPDSKVVYTGDLLFIGIAPAMWAGPAKRWVNALTKLLAQTEDKEAGWLYVPGHGALGPRSCIRDRVEAYTRQNGLVLLALLRLGGGP